LTEPIATDYNEGTVLLFNKPLRWTSFDLVKKVRNLTKAKKVGHAGTLDPLATGLMILCTGKMTKKIDSFQGMEKEYTGTFTLGEVTPSYDREQPVSERFPTVHLTEQLVLAAADRFRGKISQIPPGHSAIKVGGVRAYELARAGLETGVKSREIEIHELEITNIELPVVSFRVVCSKGTYIRTLVNDIGKELGSGACLDTLCRTRIGTFCLENAMEIDTFLKDSRSD